MDIKGIEDWGVNMNDGTITHHSGTVFTFEKGEIVDIDLKGITTKELSVLTEVAIIRYRKEKIASTFLTNEPGEVNTGKPNSSRTRLSLSKNS